MLSTFVLFVLDGLPLIGKFVMSHVSSAHGRGVINDIFTGVCDETFSSVGRFLLEQSGYERCCIFSGSSF